MNKQFEHGMMLGVVLVITSIVLIILSILTIWSVIVSDTSKEPSLLPAAPLLALGFIPPRRDDVYDLTPVDVRPAMVNYGRRAATQTAWRMFTLGASFSVLTFSLVQDWMGKDAYLRYAATHWTTLPWWVWLIPIAMLIGYAFTVAHGFSEFVGKLF